MGNFVQGLANAALNASSSVVRAVSNTVSASVGAAAAVGRALIGIPLPEKVFPVIVPLGNDQPWLGSIPNSFAPMSFFLNISKNQNLITQAVGILDAIASAAGGSIVGDINSVRGPVDTLAGGGRKQNSIRDFVPLSRTTFIPTDPNSVTAAALRQVFIPPLTLLVNPSDISYNYSKEFEPAWSQGGPLVEYAGNNMLSVQANGVSAGFVTSNLGYSRRGKTPSLGFQNLFSLYLLYRNNGNDFNVANPKNINIVGAVTMFYDGAFYSGSFENFTISESADQPFKFNYNFTFTVRKFTRLLTSDLFNNVPFTNVPF